MSYSTNFEYVLPSGLMLDIEAIATYNETTNDFSDIELKFFDLEGEEIDVQYNKEVFEEIELEAMFYLSKYIEKDVVPVDEYRGEDDYSSTERW